MKKLAYILPFIFLFTPLFAQAALTDNLVSYWKLDENTGTTVHDATGNGYNGTLSYITGPSIPSWTTGIINSGLLFNGATQLVGSEVNFGNVSPISGNSFSIAAWIYRTGDSAGGAYELGGVVGIYDNSGANHDAYTLESWSRKSAQADKWNFCLTAGTLWPANQERP